VKLKKILMITVPTICFVLGMSHANAATITIKKVEKGTSTQIKGAEMTLSKPKAGSAFGDVIAHWTTDGTTKTITVEPGNYILVENSPAPGYVTGKDMPIKITDATQTYDAISESDYTKIEISAIDSKTHKHISGVKFELISPTGTSFATWTSNGSTHRINRVPLGTYTLKVLSVPSGYKLIGNSTIVVDELCAIVKLTTVEIPPNTTPTPPPTKTPTPDEVTDVPDTNKNATNLFLGLGMLTVILGSGLTYKYGKQN